MIPAALLALTLATPPGFTSTQRGMVEQMFETVRDELHHNYYDPTFHGLDMKARDRQYELELKAATSRPQAFSVIAGYLMGLNDSHTYFIPPLYAYRYRYGFDMAMIGGFCYVVAVQPGTDAASKLHRGDQIMTLDGYTANPRNFDRLLYEIFDLAPQPEMQLRIQRPDGSAATVVVGSQRVANREQAEGLAWFIHPDTPQRTHTAGDIFLWQLPDFSVPQAAMDHIMAQAETYPNLILDLRGNPGGNVDELEHLLGRFITHDSTAFTLLGRQHRKPEVVKPHGKPYAGRLFVLVDGASGSGAEIFARVIKLEHLGTVIGDRTAGAVREATLYAQTASDQVSTQVFALPDSGVWYGAAITTADLVMADGHSLEGVGVMPDIAILPTAQDLAAGRDPVLARAIQLAGGSLDATAAGKIFPPTWPSN